MGQRHAECKLAAEQQGEKNPHGADCRRKVEHRMWASKKSASTRKRGNQILIFDPENSDLSEITLFNNSPFSFTITGFFGSVPGSLLTSIGRGYTDLAAALIAVGLDAEELQVWKEVDGIFTADPRKVKDAR